MFYFTHSVILSRKMLFRYLNFFYILDILISILILNVGFENVNVGYQISLNDIKIEEFQLQFYVLYQFFPPLTDKSDEPLTTS